MGNFFIGDILHILPALLIALTVHEYSHGRMAYHLGDPTAKASGRLTLNPIDHMDPIGLLVLAMFGFGWAKPVPVNPVNFHRSIDMRKGMLLVSLAGPASNLLMAFVFMGVSVVYVQFFQAINAFNVNVIMMYTHPVLHYIILINIFLAIFNLFPVPPLDGSRIIRAILPRKYERYFNYMDQYGFIVLLLLVFTGIVGTIVRFLSSILLALMYLPFQFF